MVKAALSRFATWLSTVLGALGIGAFVWPMAIGMGIGVGGLELFVPAFLHGMIKRRATLEFTRPSLLSTMVAAAVVAAIAALLAIRARRRGDRRSTPEIYNSNLRRGAFLAALPLVVSLAEPLEATHSWLVLTFAAVTAILVTYSAYHWSRELPDESPRSRFRFMAPTVVGVAIASYIVVVTSIAFINHLAFNTGRSDLGYYMSIFRQSSQGVPLGCSLCGNGSHLTGHFDPILVLLSPLYLLYPFAETLLLLQTVWLALGAVPVYLVTVHHVRRSSAGVALAIAYLAFPALHGVNLFDFHSLSLCVPLFIWVLYFLDSGKIRAYYLTLPLLLLVREDISIAMCLVGAGALFSKEPARVRVGLVTVAASVAYFLVAKGVFMGHIDPLNSTGTSRGYAGAYGDLIPAGKSTAGLIATVFGDPMYALTRILTEEKLDYVAKLCVPLLALPFLARDRLLLSYGAALTLLGSVPFLYSTHFQYSSMLIPFLFVLAAGALGRIRTGDVSFPRVSGARLSRVLPLGILVSTLLCSWKFGGIVPNGSFTGGFRPLVRTVSPGGLAMDAWLRKFARSLPKGAKVAANSRILTHLGPVTSVLMIDDRARADYVVAGMANHAVARELRPEIRAGRLIQLDSFDDVKIFRAHYPKAPAAAAATNRPPIEAE